MCGVLLSKFSFLGFLNVRFVACQIAEIQSKRMHYVLMFPCTSSMNSEDLLRDVLLCILIFCSPSLRNILYYCSWILSFQHLVPYSDEVSLWICSKEITLAIVRHLPCFLWILYPEGKVAYVVMSFLSSICFWKASDFHPFFLVIISFITSYIGILAVKMAHFGIILHVQTSFSQL